jgi:hypothetical protein
VIVPIDPDDSLAQRLKALGHIDAYSRKLSSGEKVGVLFAEPLSEDNLHIVVPKCPGEYRCISSFPIFVHNNDIYSFRRPALFLATFSPRLAIAVMDCPTFDVSFSLRFLFRLSADGEY